MAVLVVLLDENINQTEYFKIINAWLKIRFPWDAREPWQSNFEKPF